MQIPKSTIEEIRARTDIVEVIGRFVTLQSRGGRHVGLCPFHQEKSPSFHVIRAKQIYHCFGCKESGDAFRFLMKVQGLSFAEAAKELAGPAGVTIEERQLTPEEQERIRRKSSVYDACELAAEWFHATLMTGRDGEPGREYLRRRGMTLDTVRRFRLGFAPDQWTALTDHLHTRGVSPELAVRAGLAKRNDARRSTYDIFRNRVIIPIPDHRDRPIAFGGRLLDGEGPKYINSPETDIYEKSNTLFGLSQARAAIQRKGRVVVVEGYFDVLSLAQAGFEETVATCGTALTQRHLEMLRPLTRTVIAQFDSDEAGQRAAERALPMFLDADIEPRHLDLLGAKDPDELIQSQGAEGFERALTTARPVIERVIERVAKRHGPSSAGRKQAVEEAIPILRKLPYVMESDMLRRASNLLGVREAVLREMLDRAPVRKESAPAPTQGPARWVGNLELNRLLWLLIHFPAEAGQALAAVEDPSMVTDRQDIGRVIYRLLQGDPVTSILDDLLDPDARRVVLAAASREEQVEAERVPAMMRELLARMERRSVEARLRGLRERLAECERKGDADATRKVIVEQQRLNRRLMELMRIVPASVG